VCPNAAIDSQIDLLKCDGCGACVPACPHGAIRGGYAELRVRDVDMRNTAELAELEGIEVLRNPVDVVSVVFGM
jgi:dihydromethanopterin reductase (acceptor)